MKKQLPPLTGFLLALLAPAFALAAQAQVSIGAGSLSPSTVTINQGDTVVWTNTSATAQSITANNGSFQSGSIAPGGQFAATFNTSGTYSYYDNASGSAIIGEVVVSGNTTSGTAPAPTTYNQNANYFTNTTGSTNPTIASLTAQVQALLAQINALEGNSGGAAGTPGSARAGSCPQIGRVLSIGASGSDVASLQQFLGVSPATGYFGPITQRAVEQWQSANNIISYGTPATTGYGVVGPRTAAAIRLACNGGSSSGTGSGTGASVVSGFLQVSPISGAAPLVTTVTVTVNTAGSCSGATYALDYGDSTQGQTIAVPAGNCSQQNQVFQHTYQYGGAYTVTLSAGSHSTTATVTVSGSQASGTSTNPVQASGSLNALVTSGQAPFSTTFYVSCASGLAYDVVFGDGTDLGSSGVSQSSCGGALQSVSHTYKSPGTYNAQLVVFIRNSQGTVSSQAVATQGITVTGTSTPPSGLPPDSSFSPPTLTPGVGGNPLAVTLQFTAGVCSSAYNITWGDSGITPGPLVDFPAGSTCPKTQTQSDTVSHTYSAAGSYTITLTRNTSSGSTQTDTVGVSITS